MDKGRSPVCIALVSGASLGEWIARRGVRKALELHVGSNSGDYVSIDKERKSQTRCLDIKLDGAPS